MQYFEIDFYSMFYLRISPHDLSVLHMINSQTWLKQTNSLGLAKFVCHNRDFVETEVDYAVNMNLQLKKMEKCVFWTRSLL
jgi:hypothetical protein